MGRNQRPLRPDHYDNPKESIVATQAKDDQPKIATKAVAQLRCKWTKSASADDEALRPMPGYLARARCQATGPDEPEQWPGCHAIASLSFSGSLSSPGNALDLRNPGEIGLMAFTPESFSDGLGNGVTGANPLVDNVGVSINNFSFPTAAVPEPATWAMIILGCGGPGRPCAVAAASRSQLSRVRPAGFRWAVLRSGEVPPSHGRTTGRMGPGGPNPVNRPAACCSSRRPCATLPPSRRGAAL